MSLEKVYEGSTAYLTVSFYDKAGELAEPSGITWEAHDIATNTELKAAAAVTPGETVEITIPPSVNTLVDQDKAEEKHRVTIKASYGVDDMATSLYDFWVVSLEQVIVGD